MTRRPRLARAALLLLLAATACYAQQREPENAGPYVPTPWVIVDEVLKLGGAGPGDFVVDLGSGDGRLVLTAVSRYGARGGFGVDILADLVAEANATAKRQGVDGRVRFFVRDLFDTPVGEATLVTLYLLPTSVPKLESKLLAELAPGARVVSHDYPFPNWPHDRFVKMDVPEKVAISGTPRTTLYLYTVPARIAGEWDLRLPGRQDSAPLRLSVQQRASGATARVGTRDRVVDVPELSVHGADVRITLPAGAAGPRPVTLQGQAVEGALEGTTDGGRWRAVRATR
jgi:hypothetical protein